MSVTWEKIEESNAAMKRIDVKGKNYACVPARVQAFRKMCPDGAITTEILMMEHDEVVIKATVIDENGRVLATGIANELKSSSYINKTSYIENCETSAVGRALGMLGIGSEEQMASAEELVNAITNQEKKPEPRRTEKTEAQKVDELVSKAWGERIKKCEQPVKVWKLIAARYSIKDISDLTIEMATDLNTNWEKIVAEANK